MLWNQVFPYFLTNFIMETSTLPAPVAISEARLYVGDYASYNSGSIAGRWIELDGKTADEIRSEIDSVLRENSARLRQTCEEPMYLDYEGFPKALYSESSIDVNHIVAYLECNDYEKDQIVAYLEVDPSPQHALENYRDVEIFYERAELIDYYFDYCPEVPEQYLWLIDEDKLFDWLLQDYTEIECGWLVRLP